MLSNTFYLIEKFKNLIFLSIKSMTKTKEAVVKSEKAPVPLNESS